MYLCGRLASSEVTYILNTLNFAYIALPVYQCISSSGTLLVHNNWVPLLSFEVEHIDIPCLR
jgi:hypothetical protein